MSSLGRLASASSTTNLNVDGKSLSASVDETTTAKSSDLTNVAKVRWLDERITLACYHLQTYNNRKEAEKELGGGNFWLSGLPGAAPGLRGRRGCGSKRHTLR